MALERRARPLQRAVDRGRARVKDVDDLPRREAESIAKDQCSALAGRKGRASFQEEHPLIVAPILTDAQFGAGKGPTASEVAEIVRGLRMTVAITLWGFPPWREGAIGDR